MTGKWEWGEVRDRRFSSGTLRFEAPLENSGQAGELKLRPSREKGGGLKTAAT
jgi:hypothetical protein